MEKDFTENAKNYALAEQIFESAIKELAEQSGIGQGNAGMAIHLVALDRMIATAPSGTLAICNTRVSLFLASKASNSMAARDSEHRALRKAMKDFATAVMKFYNESLAQQAKENGRLS